MKAAAAAIGCNRYNATHAVAIRPYVILTAAPPAVLTRYSRGSAGTRAVLSAVSTLRRLRTERARPHAMRSEGALAARHAARGILAGRAEGVQGVL
jgi:hypothetical protein